MAEFTDEELRLIKNVTKRFQADIDGSRVAELVNSPEFDPYDFQLQMFENPRIGRTAPPEVWAAMTVEIFRDSKRENADSIEENFLTTWYVTSSGAEASAGLQIIKDLNEFWRFRPTIETILDLDSEQLQTAGSYMRSFQGSDYENVYNRNKEDLIERYQKWDVSDLSTENINLGREIYEECVKIFERGFPNLLALKRILDGEDPSVEELQRIRASRVRRELTNEEDEPNSVYFDLIVNRFDSTLRNGTAHNDIITDPTESVVRVPIDNSEYDYEEFNKIVKENIANAIFVTGAYQSLVEWHAATARSEYREERPDWVFGE